MKVSVITLVRIHNYGSVLQAYATSQAIESLGHQPEFVDLTAVNGSRRNSLKENLKIRDHQDCIKRAFYTAAWNVNWLCQERVFGSFVDSNLKFTRRYQSVSELYSDPPHADVYLSGSDMLWSTVLNKGHNQKQFYLDWVPEGKRRIAYAASIGETSLDEAEKDFLRPLLSRYDWIGMRERSGVDLLSDIGIRSRNVLDPTLLMKEEDWRNIGGRIPRDAPFLLVYFLHEHPELADEIRRFADNRGLIVVRIAFTPRRREYDDAVELTPTVERFVSLFANASFVVTDSFHGTAFSLNCGRNFLSVRPPRFMTRLSSILEMTGTLGRVINNPTQSFDDYEPIDFDYVKTAIESARSTSVEFLRDAIDG